MLPIERFEISMSCEFIFKFCKLRIIIKMIRAIWDGW